MSHRHADWQQRAFKALADPTRRHVLMLLRTREECLAGEIADSFPDMSRPAVSRHLRVLREAGLVTADGVGREQRYRLSLLGLARVHHEWFAKFDDLWGAALAALKERAESRAPRSRERRAPTADQEKRRA